MTPVRLESAAIRSRVKHSTTEPLRSHKLGLMCLVDLLCFFCVAFAMPLCASVYLCLVVTCWERADLGSRLWCLAVSLSLSHWYPVSGSGVVLDCIDS